MTIRQNGQILAGAVTGPYKANTDMDNLTDVGKNIANWSNNVTNCITEIPQDIKLELNNGTLTLKAGSKVYVPNGFETDGTTPKFDVVTIESDASISSLWTGTGSGSRVNAIFLSQNNTLKTIGIDYENSSWWSGSNPTITKTYGYRYNITTNFIQQTSDTGSTWTGNYSLPIALVSADNNNKTPVSIDQIFNGFGYIGSTVFALPGVKGLIPNGRNADGSLKNIKSTLTKVHTYWLDQAWGTVFSGHKFYLRVFDEVQGNYAGDVQPDTRVIYSKGIPSSTYTGVYYDTEENKWFWVNNGEISVQDKMFLGISFIANITATTFTVDGNWNPKTPFHALDYNDSSTISGWAMPSSRYIDLTLLASGATYTAPANGYISMVMDGTVSGNMGYFSQLYENDVEIRRFGDQSTSGAYHVFALNFEIRKGQIFSLAYYGTTPNYFRFVYAEGENV